jgi:hypothetical protein
MSKDLAQIMKNLRTENDSNPVLPKSGHVTATMLVKAARDYANLHQDLNVRQEISLQLFLFLFIDPPHSIYRLRSIFRTFRYIATRKMGSFYFIFDRFEYISSSWACVLRHQSTVQSNQ